MVVSPFELLRGVHHSTLPSQCDTRWTMPSSLCCVHPSIPVLAWFVCYIRMNCSLGVRKHLFWEMRKSEWVLICDQRTDCRLDEPCSYNHWQLEHGSHIPTHLFFKAAHNFKKRKYIERERQEVAVSVFPLQTTWLVLLIGRHSCILTEILLREK
jgi:hypothetical protein